MSLESIGILVGIIAAVFAGIGVMLGAAWWMSSMYSELRRVGSSIHGLRNDMTVNNTKIEMRLNEFCDQIDNHEKRIIIVEERMPSRREWHDSPRQEP